MAKNIRNSIAGLTVATLGLLAFNGAQAASVSYVLDQSNALPDNNDYLRVTIEDGLNGAIDFTVEVLSALSDIASSNFGMQSFGFNVDEGDTDASNVVVGLPADWVASDGKQMANFGRFDIVVHGDGNSRTSVLTFSIDGIDGDTVTDYVALSSGRSANPKVDFAAHVAGFSFDDGSNGTIDSAFFGGSTLEGGGGPVVPVPGAVWFFGSAIGLLGVIRRNRQSL